MGPRQSNDGSVDLLKQFGSNSPEEMAGIIDGYRKHVKELTIKKEKKAVTLEE